jgi:hypothetical protein
LIRKLAIEAGRRDAGGDDLKAAAASLVAVISFLHGDGAVILGGITRPLALLQAAIDDTIKGASPALFFMQQRLHSRPTNIAFDVARGQMAELLEVLVRSKLRTGQAAAWLADRVAERAITYYGKPITPHMLRRWWEEVRERKAPRRRVNMLERVKRKAPPNLTTRRDAERWCIAMLDSLRRIFP